MWGVSKRSRWLLVSIAALLMVALVSGCGAGKSTAPASSGADPAAPADKKGGILRVAIIGEPPTLDMHTTTATITFEVGWTLFETLYTYTADYGIQPMLAESMPEIKDGGKIFTIKLREGVPFHNGKEMTSADVLASIERWAKLAQNAKGALAGMKSVKALDKYTIEFEFEQPAGTLMIALSTPGNGLAIYPKELVDKYPDTAMQEYIGTGPYKMAEYVRDRHIQMVRFDDYAARSEESDGPGGKKHAYVDEIRFIPVPDINTRLSGLESGDYDVAAVLSGNQLESVKANSNLQSITVKPVSHLGVNFNMKQGPFTNKLVRQAAAAVIDADLIMQAAFGHKDLYRIDPGLMQQEQSVWYTDAGKENYNQKNVEKAKKLLAEAGYKGEKIRYMATKEYDYNYKGALVLSEQMKAAGFNVELVVSDWATLVGNRANPEIWEMFSTGISVKNSPLMLASMGDKWFGWWQNAERDALARKIGGELDPSKAAVHWVELQKLYYEEVPSTKIGDYFAVRAARSNVKNVPTMSEYYFWNTYFEQK